MKPSSSGRPNYSGGPVQRKVFDVMRPGRAPADSTSKPVIVGHKPMVQNSEATVSGIGPRPLMNPARKITINPAPNPESNHASDSTAVTALPTPLPASPAPTVPIHHNESVPVPDTSSVAITVNAPEPPAPAPTISTLAAVEPTQTPPPSTLRPLDVPATPPSANEDDFPEDMPAPVIDTKEPVAPSTHIGPSAFPWKWVVISVVIVLFVLAILDILLDADFISWGVPHTRFLQ